MAYDLDPAYKQVPERIADLKAKHPDACLRPLIPERPYWVETIAEKTYIVYAAACYRTPDDPMPGVGVAWEPFPGRTPYTRDSELQNAETSAWGRAIVATLASESKAVASAEDVRNRAADHAPDPAKEEARALRLEVASLAQREGWDLDTLGQEFTQTFGVSTSSAGPDDLAAYLSELQARASGGAPADETPTDAPPQPSPPSAGEGSPDKPQREAKSPDHYRDLLLAATTRPEVTRALRDASLDGHADAEIADENGVATTINVLAAKRMKATGK